MRRYLKSIGFSMYKKKTEIKELMDKIQNENIALSKIIVTPEKERLWEIRSDLSESFGICLYGYLDNLNRFIREGFFPYINNIELSSNAGCTVQKHLDDELYSGMLDDNRVGISLIFRLSNSFEYADKKNDISIEGAGLFGFCDDGKVLLPIKKTSAQKELSKQMLLNRNMLIEAARNGDEEAIDTLSTDEFLTYSSVNSRMMKEDIYSIIDSLFMPFGLEADMYNVIGDILEIKESKNKLTSETILLLKIECSDIILQIAANKHDVEGEPAIGRRFKGTLRLFGDLRFKKH